jgi:hypothetical protein
LKGEQRMKKADILLIGGIIAFGCILGLVILLTQHEGNIVQVRVDKTIIENLQITDNITYEIKGINGGTNLLIIQDGEAWVEESSCPDGLCKKMGKISQVGQTIICLPNKVVVEIFNKEGEISDTPDVDVIAR